MCNWSVELDLYSFLFCFLDTLGLSNLPNFVVIIFTLSLYLMNADKRKFKIFNLDTGFSGFVQLSFPLKDCQREYMAESLATPPHEVPGIQGRRCSHPPVQCSASTGGR